MAGVDARVVVHTRRATPVTVVLQPATNPVRIPVVYEDVVILRQAEVAEYVEIGSTVIARLDATVAARQDTLSVPRIDPERLVVAVHAPADALDGAPAVGGLGETARQCIQGVVIAGIHEHVRVIERPEVEILVVADRLPRLTVILRPEKRSRRRVLGNQVDDVRTRLRDADADARHGLVRCCGDFLPRITAVPRQVQCRLPAAVVEPPRAASEGPHAGVHIARVGQIDVEVGTARVLIDVEDLGPGLAGVGRLEDAALFVGAPLVAQGAHQRHVRIARIDHDPLDALSIG